MYVLVVFMCFCFVFFVVLGCGSAYFAYISQSNDWLRRRSVFCTNEEVGWEDHLTYIILTGLLNITTVTVCTPVINVFNSEVGVPRRQSHRRSGLANLPSVGAVP